MSAIAPPVVIRAIRPADAPLLADGLTRLSPETVYRRFLSPKPRLSRRELRYLTEVDGVDHLALVAFDGPQLVAVARWVRLTDDPETAEAAIVVADCRQGQGIGRTLGYALADAASERGVRRFEATMLPDNAAAHRLFDVISDRLRAAHAAALATAA